MSTMLWKIPDSTIKKHVKGPTNLICHVSYWQLEHEWQRDIAAITKLAIWECLQYAKLQSLRHRQYVLIT
ncbi:hypothetical protein RGQ29_014436 [Quercus rubra]|uniref:Uncharacterized protein n=1 Tax=Quercus rubra TaxID=3512 RepID=A0AAN7FS81_QUERU|nr:hypothetical protein RGQ29_014436 [Quercus rubra]